MRDLPDAVGDTNKHLFFSIEYLITKDGRVRVKLFNQSVNSDIIQERNRYKTGVSLSYKREYDKLIELFRKKDQ